MCTLRQLTIIAMLHCHLQHCHRQHNILTLWHINKKHLSMMVLIAPICLLTNYLMQGDNSQKRRLDYWERQKTRSFATERRNCHRHIESKIFKWLKIIIKSNINLSVSGCSWENRCKRFCNRKIGSSTSYGAKETEGLWGKIFRTGCKAIL